MISRGNTSALERLSSESYLIARTPWAITPDLINIDLKDMTGTNLKRNECEGRKPKTA
jgi:hypothetical protein